MAVPSRLIEFTGRLLQWISLCFIAWLAIKYADALPITPSFGMGLAAGCLVALLSIPLPIIAWRLLISGNERTIRFGAVFTTYARSALAKYLPGNFLHYVGRQMLGARHGLPQSAMAMASLCEVLLVIAAGCTLSLLASIRLTELSFPAGMPLQLVVTILWAGILLPVSACLSLGHLRFGWLDQLPLQPVPVKHLVVSFGCLLAFVAGGALSMWIVALIGIGNTADILALALAAYGISYVLGYVTPGSPGGLGIREALLVLLLSGATGEELALVMAIGQRLAWLAAELLLYAAAVWLDRRSQQAP